MAKEARFSLLRTIQGILHKRDLEAHDQPRVVWCHRTIVTGSEAVGVYRTEAGDNARLSGLHTCGSVWDCPVCAAKVAEKRRAELSAGMAAWIAQGGKVHLLNLTFPHEADMPLAELLTKQAKALQMFKNSRDYKNAMERAGRAGSVKSLEVTWGINGWHPHTHDLVFVKSSLTHGHDDEDLQHPEQYRGTLARLRDRWIKCLLRAGLGSVKAIGDMEKHSFLIHGGEKAAEYVAKFGRDESGWGLSSELTRTHSKIGARGEWDGVQHFTPFQLALWAQNGDRQAAGLFREYSAAFAGKRMLTWSPGLKKTLLGDDSDLTDEQIAAQEEPMPEENKVGFLTSEQYRVLLSRNAVGEFLRYVATCCHDPDTGQQDLDDFITSLETRAETHGGRMRLKRTFAGGYSEVH